MTRIQGLALAVALGMFPAWEVVAEVAAPVAPVVAAPVVAAPAAPVVAAPTMAAPVAPVVASPVAPVVAAPTPPEVAAPAAPVMVAPIAPAPLPAAVTALVAPPSPPKVVGSYDIVGKNAVDKSSYQGVASVYQQGELYRVVYADSEQKLTGIGILAGNALGVAYATDQQPTILVLTPNAKGGWSGHWAFGPDEFLSSEEWNRR